MEVDLGVTARALVGFVGLETEGSRSGLGASMRRLILGVGLGLRLGVGRRLNRLWLVVLLLIRRKLGLFVVV